MTCALAVACGCDPMDKITVRFAVYPGRPTPGTATVSAYWVKTYEGRTYPAQRIDKREVAEPEFVVTSQECCGTAAAYRARELAFLACIAKPGLDPVLVCGSVGAP